MEVWKSYLTELLGTFILVFVGTGSVVTALFIGDGLTVPGILLIALTFGLTLTVIIYSLGSVSGAHVNPAVTIAASLAGKLKARHIIPYIVMQLLGAVIASFFILVIVGITPYGIGQNITGAFGIQSALLTETILTMLFVLVILKTANNNNAALAIGFFLAVAHLFAIPVSGSSLNPARSFGPAVVIGGQALNQLWIYIAAPIFGSILGAVIYMLIFEERKFEERK